MREISPAHNATVDDFLSTASPKVLEIVKKIRDEKKNHSRPLPSKTLIDNSQILTETQRINLLDESALLVDENLFGRSEMCIQFAQILQKGLMYLGINSRVIMGKAFYFLDGNEIFRWDHAWVRIGKEVIDGNVDILYENPFVPNNVKIKPFWGPVANIPSDRRLRETTGVKVPNDDDVNDIWWPDLQRKLIT